VPPFQIKSAFAPSGDQPKAITELTQAILNKKRYSTLIGVTGSGKTFTVANLIQNIQRPTLVIAHNKTLAAQLYQEFRDFFPDNAVEYFVSYYDYYQPEAYIPTTDTYIEKDSAINDEIDKLRQRATMALLTRRDVIVVASVSCIYGLGSPEIYFGMVLQLEKGKHLDRDETIRKLIEIQYERNPIDFSRGKFRVSGDVLEIFPSYEDTGLRIEFFGDEVDRISRFDTLTGKSIEELDKITVFPAKHWVMPALQLKSSIEKIREELQERIEWFTRNNMPLEAERIRQRTNFDLEMMQEIGYCTGIENYSRILSNRPPGSAPETLVDYLPDDALVVIDESHVTIPQIRGMYAGDRSRKKNLIDYGFRLPSAFDNRPLKFDEFHAKIHSFLFVSATPGDWELKKSKDSVIEQIIRPTGLIDPEIIIRPVKNQVDDLVNEIHKQVEAKERVLVTTLTKKMAENLNDYFTQLGIRSRYLHSSIETLERTEIIRGLRLGEFDVLVGVNLLREGLDMPEVSLVAVLDADKEGFLRSDRALIQTIGRCARNARSRAIFYADHITDSMQRAIDETNRRRKIQSEYNQAHGIIPKTIIRPVQDAIIDTPSVIDAPATEVGLTAGVHSDEDIGKLIIELEKKMKQAAKELDFELAAHFRDRLIQLKEFMLGVKK
jgi:excinuclease ABC subunit B